MKEAAPHTESLSANEIFSTLRNENESVRSIDPLVLDHFFQAEFHSLIEKNDTESLERILSEKSASIPESITEKKAYTRDIGMIMAAIKRLNNSWNPSEEVQERLLLVAAETTESPRDSVFSYGPRNPEGKTRRMFIGSPEEASFIESFTEGMKGLDECLENILAVFEKETYGEIVKALNAATIAFDKMIGAIVAVRRVIKPEYFTDVMRPFFEPLIIGGKSFSAPGGAQMPILILDALTWAKDVDQDYIDYVTENLRYIPQGYHQLLLRSRSLESIESYVLSKKDLSDNANTEPKMVFGQLKRLMDKIVAFRVPHLRVARDNFKLRPEGSVGSGGYKPDMLEIILQQTKDYRDKIAAYESRI